MWITENLVYYPKNPDIFFLYYRGENWDFFVDFPFNFREFYELRYTDTHFLVHSMDHMYDRLDFWTLSLYDKSLFLINFLLFYGVIFLLIFGFFYGIYKIFRDQ